MTDQLQRVAAVCDEHLAVAQRTREALVADVGELAAALSDAIEAGASCSYSATAAALPMRSTSLLS
jgi:hypothetical protein